MEIAQELVRVRPDQLAHASAVLARAFQDDPAWRWVIPSASRREALLPWLFRTGFELTDAELWAPAGEMTGCARWLPPHSAGTRMAVALKALVAMPLRLREAMPRFLSYGRAVEDLRFRAVSEPHWYLAGIGVLPTERRKGIGGALMRPGIEGAQRDGVPCVLLTNEEANLSFYRSHGFEVTLEADTPTDGPHAWVLVRQPESKIAL